jgi:S-sulfo-L-cysteine synthase (3-phospho-L-serine-dependent)
MPGRLIFVESNTTGSGMLALTAAHRLGLEPLLLTSNPRRYAGLAGSGAEVVDCDTNTLAALTEAVARRRGGIAGITTTSEFYLVAAAELADRLGLPGNPPNAVRLCRDKSRTRLVLAAARLPQPRFVMVRDSRQLSLPLREVGLPCVVKPVDESGSDNVRLCRSEPQVRAHLRTVLAARVNARNQPAAGVALVEEYLDGPEYSVEMFSTAGVARCIGITAKSVRGDPYFVESGHHYPAPLDPPAAERLVGTVEAALGVVGVRTGPTHTEVKLLPDGPAIVEINVRLAGGMIPELIRLADGVDLLEQQVRAAAGLPVDLAARPGPDPCVGIRFVTARRRGTVLAVTGTDDALAQPGVRAVSVPVQPGARVVPARNAYERVGHVIAAGACPRAVESTLDRAVDLIRVAVAADDARPTGRGTP